ncbi:MAG: type III secretion system chaperone, partial [Propionibacteriaceae bacterium]|nr:type III secretion system chaperone [Propionibacteriaceae bacterium]
MPISQRAVLLAAGLSLLAACTASPSATAPATSAGPAITAPAAPSSASPTATTTTEAAAACPSGEYTMTSFAATGTNGALGKGNGGDVSAEFENGRYDIDFDDDEPIALTLDDDTGELLVDGSIEGTYTGTGENLTFTRGKVEGTAKLRHQGESRSLSIEQIAKVLGLSGKGSATC